MFKHLATAIILLCSLVSISYATETMKKHEGGSHDCTSCHKLTEKEANALLSKIGGTVKSVKPSPAKGLFELFVEKDGKQGIIFVDFGKKHLLQGMVVDLETLQPVSAHAQDMPQQKQLTNVDVSKIPADKAVVMGNPKGTKKLFVFTDPDCPYCRKLHPELQKLAKIAPDAAIHVMLMPLAMHPQAYDKARVVLETRSQDLLDKSFEGKELPKPKKESSKADVDAIIKYCESVGINGTPTMVLPNGKVIVGMRDAETLKGLLESK